ncbi:hypothetical protein Q9Q94_02130 [Uliginosibacterium sp. 31-16]|uniref:hypothetical protein n=1 Tax=Uliginosibacterium sp. 31-16 TaxID=3068315 RepID=UPI00273E72F4|nr:hypothetical protein [Uliginosibacterium sp. 31-16]MDP5238304.1 hypothetical protein [Uliginosibacterium sp. 31-16]
MRSTTRKTAPIAREIQLDRGMSQSIHACRQTRIICIEGRMEISQTIMWVGTLPLRITRHLCAGDTCLVEESGWLLLRAENPGSRLQLEAPQRTALSAFLAPLRSWLGSHLHLPGGTAQAH